MSKPERRILRLKETEARTGYARPTIYRLEAQGEFPARIKLGRGQGGAVGWDSQEIDAWIEARRCGEPWRSTRAAGGKE